MKRLFAGRQAGDLEYPITAVIARIFLFSQNRACRRTAVRNCTQQYGTQSSRGSIACFNKQPQRKLEQACIVAECSRRSIRYSRRTSYSGAVYLLDIRNIWRRAVPEFKVNGRDALAVIAFIEIECVIPITG
ncbi:hypothetical protein D3C71_1681040 [compost metagenome]